MTKIILKFRNEFCGCDRIIQKIEINNEDDIVNAILDGIPICPECGEDMECIE